MNVTSRLIRVKAWAESRVFEHLRPLACAIHHQGSFDLRGPRASLRAKFSPAMFKWRQYDASQTELRPYLVSGISSRGDRFRASSTHPAVRGQARSGTSR